MSVPRSDTAVLVSAPRRPWWWWLAIWVAVTLTAVELWMLYAVVMGYGTGSLLEKLAG